MVGTRNSCRIAVPLGSIVDENINVQVVAIWGLLGLTSPLRLSF
jgi:hypothetical protein